MLIPTDGLQKADAMARRYFTYEEDPAGKNTWRSHMADAVISRDWKGDCDDLASTVLDILVELYPSANLNDLYRLKVKTAQCPEGKPYDHMVAAVRDAQGVVWIVGDTFEGPHRIENSQHGMLRAGVIAESSCVAEGVRWRSGVGDLLPAS